MKRLLCLTLVSLFAFGAGPALAAPKKPAGPPKPVERNGTIVSIGDTLLVLRVGKGQEIKLTIMPETQFGAANERSDAGRFKPGNHVKATIIKGEGGKQELKQVVPVVRHGTQGSKRR